MLKMFHYKTYGFKLLFKSNPGEESWSLKFYLEIYGLIIFNQFITLNFFPVANNRRESDVNWLLIKLQRSTYWWRLAKKTEK